MASKRKTIEIIRQFKNSNEQVINLPFDGIHNDASQHWHDFLGDSWWNLIKKGVVMAISRNLPSGKFKNMLLRSIGVKIGQRVFIASTVALDLQFPELITIEDGVIIGMGAHIATHEVTHTHIRLGKVHIGKNALIGGQSTVRSGVNIGENAVVALRAFVTESVPDNTLVTGVPDRKVVELHNPV
ncbi:MAG: acyltransferase [Planctomycetota bacterium]|nr:acyltransferase [Planctomycetota bacterium]